MPPGIYFLQDSSNTQRNEQRWTHSRDRKGDMHHQGTVQVYCKHPTIHLVSPWMIIELVFNSVFWLNAFARKKITSDTISLRTIVLGCHVDYNVHCRLQYGKYVQTHEKHDSSMTSIAVGALIMCPSSNKQGRHYFFSLLTGRRLHRVHWTLLPMPEDAISRVHSFARCAKARIKGAVFTNEGGRVLYNNQYDNSDNKSTTSNSSSNNNNE